eukprot:CAMPEP_0176419878 /NCGR_PEP_ID=MMETSP0127-20121128/8298_1 /TAXON_ID=938130 /ORGANISM="Platyophrya macrostoma, Strain WH" /LENGTH=386 /DNA_ID=CAMNT_0017800417 /DNA_START=396 /DNA_END=1556 /DNA_ORIENTATION=+
MLHSTRHMVGLRDATTSASVNGLNPLDDAALTMRKLGAATPSTSAGWNTSSSMVRPSTSLEASHTPTTHRRQAAAGRPQLHQAYTPTQHTTTTPSNGHSRTVSGASGMETPQTMMRPMTSSLASTPRTVVRQNHGQQQHVATPQKSLFSSPVATQPQRFLLRDIEPHQSKPLLTVVFDLDETLVSNRRADLAQAILRPYALHVLNALRHMANLEVVMWTASTRETGAPVVEQLSMGGLVFDDVVFRSDAWFTEPIHTKDLRLLGRDLDRVVIFDNAPSCCKLNAHNSVIVEDFHGLRTENDAALVNCYYIIESLLKQAGEGTPVREGLQRLLSEGHLCRPVVYQLPDTWSKVNLRDVPPIRIPPHGKYVRAHTLPPNAQTMKHWTI